MNKSEEIQKYYTELFTENPLYSIPFPNVEEARRWSKIGEFLSEILESNSQPINKNLRILDVGCGRGWLTYMSNIYGKCEGIDPVKNSIDLARKLFPELTFHECTATELLQSPGFQPYDVIITSEVIEHITDKENFVKELRNCLVPNGYVIITTPRGELFKEYLQSGYPLQPIEEWITENELYSLFKKNRFSEFAHDRAYIDLPQMSLIYQLLANPRFVKLLRKIGLTWLYQGLAYSFAIYQIWSFKKMID
jgi:2-polyprenyl-3-methyl-5-hydroxy-6-metoxy-1,4-benzoquinol methylase